MRGKYVDVFGTEDADAEDEDDDDDDDDSSLGLDDDLLTGMRRFAWAYAKEVGGLVMGVVDGLAGGTR